MLTILYGQHSYLLWPRLIVVFVRRFSQASRGGLGGGGGDRQAAQWAAKSMRHAMPIKVIGLKTSTSNRWGRQEQEKRKRKRLGLDSRPGGGSLMHFNKALPEGLMNAKVSRAPAKTRRSFAALSKKLREQKLWSCKPKSQLECFGRIQSENGKWTRKLKLNDGAACKLLRRSAGEIDSKHKLTVDRI